MSLLELLAILEKELGRPIEHSFADWRPGDQRVFISDVSKAKRDFGWSPTTNTETGVQRLLEWARANEKLITEIGLI